MSDALKQSLDLSMFWEYRAILLEGLIFNALVFLCAASVALSVGLGAALLRVNRFWPMRWIGTLHVELFRNAPDYIMLVWVHFVLPLLIGMYLIRLCLTDDNTAHFGATLRNIAVTLAAVGLLWTIGQGDMLQPGSRALQPDIVTLTLAVYGVVGTVFTLWRRTLNTVGSASLLLTAAYLHHLLAQTTLLAAAHPLPYPRVAFHAVQAGLF